MLVLPVVVGGVASGLRPWHALLLVAWLSAYLAFHATGLWLRSRRKARYLRPVQVYGALTVALGLAVVVGEPPVLRWAVVYLPLLATSLRFSWLRADRSLANDLVTVLAACLMTVVADSPDLTDPRAWWLAAVLVAYFAGTVLYVKTMIRERGNAAMLRASEAYHVAAVAVVGAVTLWAARGVGSALVLAGLFALLAVRAVLVPRVWPGATPKAVGLGEMVVCAALGAALLTG
ncbi:MAG: YwiC-like family protein [Cellulomonadaceae bacterium]|nr:YwiC-like family protein [Cellulomonadaceae bacterium]